MTDMRPTLDDASADERVERLKERPRLDPRVVVHPPAEEGSPWVVQDRDGKFLRVQKDLARLLQTVDGELDHAGLADELGPPWDTNQVTTVLDQVWERGLLDTGDSPQEPNDLFRFVPPFTFQFTLLRPQRLLVASLPLIRLAASKPARVLAVMVVVAGLIALAAQAPAVVDVLSRPLPLLSVLGVILATYLTTVLHEFAHGAVLVYHGGRPTRMGVMVFYLLPAFFCDVSDGWRLPHRRQRVQIALAGVAVQFLCACLVALVSLGMALAGSTGEAYVALLLYSASTLLAGLLNLLPFVKLDGYIALMSSLDTPNLRDRAIDRVSDIESRVLFGGRGTPSPRVAAQAAGMQERLPGWGVPYGLMAQLFPALLLVLALGLWTDLLHGAGIPGAIVVGVIVVGALCYVGYAIGRMAVAARRRGSSLARIALGFVAITAAASAALALIRLPVHVVGGYVGGEGEPRLVLNSADEAAAVEPGDPVLIHRRGLVTRVEVGEAVVVDGPMETMEVPLSALVPAFEDISADPLLVAVDGLPLQTGRMDEDLHYGTATVDTGESRPLAIWLYLRYFAPVLGT